MKCNQDQLPGDKYQVRSSVYRQYSTMGYRSSIQLHRVTKNPRPCGGKVLILFTVTFGIEAILLNSWTVVPVSLCSTGSDTPIEYLRRHKTGPDSH